MAIVRASWYHRLSHGNTVADRNLHGGAFVLRTIDVIQYRSDIEKTPPKQLNHHSRAWTL